MLTIFLASDASRCCWRYFSIFDLRSWRIRITNWQRRRHVTSLVDVIYLLTYFAFSSWKAFEIGRSGRAFSSVTSITNCYPIWNTEYFTILIVRNIMERKKTKYWISFPLVPTRFLLWSNWIEIIYHIRCEIYSPFLLHATHAENFSMAESSITDVVESASQTGVVDVTSHPSCLPLMSLQILHSPVDKHFRLGGIVGHFPMVSPFPLAPS